MNAHRPAARAARLRLHAARACHRLGRRASSARVLSCWLVLIGWSLMGDAVSHAVLPGVVLAYVLGAPFARRRARVRRRAPSRLIGVVRPHEPRQGGRRDRHRVHHACSRSASCSSRDPAPTSPHPLRQRARRLRRELVAGDRRRRGRAVARRSAAQHRDPAPRRGQARQVEGDRRPCRSPIRSLGGARTCCSSGPLAEVHGVGFGPARRPGAAPRRVVPGRRRRRGRRWSARTAPARRRCCGCSPAT